MIPANELQPPLVLPRWGDVGYSELLKIGWCRLLRIVKDRLVQVKDLLVLVTLVDVSNVSFHWDFCAVLGTVRAHLGQARYPTWASTLPHLGTFAARMLPICPQYGRLRLGLSRILLVHLFATNQEYLSLPVG
ncbi:hypothetical protein ST42_12820 [Prevotella pectinovora]|nr:hypothetical protein ST42_12820 [Prevotella pectinovora]